MLPKAVQAFVGAVAVGVLGRFGHNDDTRVNVKGCFHMQKLVKSCRLFLCSLSALLRLAKNDLKRRQKRDAKETDI